jgi:hypothetical protein
MGTLKTIFAKNEPIGSEGWIVVLRKLVNAVAPSTQTFQSGTERGREPYIYLAG